MAGVTKEQKLALHREILRHLQYAVGGGPDPGPYADSEKICSRTNVNVDTVCLQPDPDHKFNEAVKLILTTTD